MQLVSCQAEGTALGNQQEECVAVLIELYKNDVSVSCVGSHFLSDWALFTANSNDIHHGI